MKILWQAWYGDEEIELDFPATWRVQKVQMDLNCCIQFRAKNGQTSPFPQAERRASVSTSRWMTTTTAP